jgi:hypothetical protein
MLNLLIFEKYKISKKNNIILTGLLMVSPIRNLIFVLVLLVVLVVLVLLVVLLFSEHSNSLPNYLCQASQ